MIRDRRQRGSIKKLIRRIQTTPALLPPADLADRTMAAVSALAEDRTAGPLTTDRRFSDSQRRESAIYCFGVAAVHLAAAVIFAYVWLNCRVFFHFHLPPWFAFQPVGWLLAAALLAVVGWLVSPRHHGFSRAIRWLILVYMGFFPANGLWAYSNLGTAAALQGALLYMAAGLSVGLILGSRLPLWRNTEWSQ